MPIAVYAIAASILGLVLLIIGNRAARRRRRAAAARSAHSVTVTTFDARLTSLLKSTGALAAAGATLLDPLRDRPDFGT